MHKIAALFLALTLSTPNPALALRTMGADAEEVRREIRAGMEEKDASENLATHPPIPEEQLSEGVQKALKILRGHLSSQAGSPSVSIWWRKTDPLRQEETERGSGLVYLEHQNRFWEPSLLRRAFRVPSRDLPLIRQAKLRDERINLAEVAGLVAFHSGPEGQPDTESPPVAFLAIYRHGDGKIYLRAEDAQGNVWEEPRREIQKEDYFYYLGGLPVYRHFIGPAQVPRTVKEARALAEDLSRQGKEESIDALSFGMRENLRLVVPEQYRDPQHPQLLIYVEEKLREAGAADWALIIQGPEPDVSQDRWLLVHSLPPHEGTAGIQLISPSLEIEIIGVEHISSLSYTFLPVSERFRELLAQIPKWWVGEPIKERFEAYLGGMAAAVRFHSWMGPTMAIRRRYPYSDPREGVDNEVLFLAFDDPNTSYPAPLLSAALTSSKGALISPADFRRLEKEALFYLTVPYQDHTEGRFLHVYVRGRGRYPSTSCSTFLQGWRVILSTR